MQSIKAWFFVLLQFIVPKLLITKIIYRITRIEQNNFKNLLINKFINLFQINTQEVKKSIPADFASLNEFFIRELNSDARIISTSPKSIISPADGKISALGNITKNQILQAKNYYEILLTANQLKQSPATPPLQHLVLQLPLNSEDPLPVHK